MRLERCKKGLALLLLSCAAVMSAAQSTEEAKVRAVVEHENAGWSAFDAKQVASVFTADAIWQNPFGVRLHGSAELEKFLKNLFARPGYRSAKDTSPPKITDVKLLSPTAAVVWSEESSEGQIDDATGKPMLPRHSHYLEVLVKTDAGWKISQSMIMDELHR